MLFLPESFNTDRAFVRLFFRVNQHVFRFVRLERKFRLAQWARVLPHPCVDEHVLS